MLSDKLTPLQRDFLAAFFNREQRFFLTGGAALAGFYLGHRQTHDLDLFTTIDVLDEGVAVVRHVARDLEASLEAIQTTPDFRRFLLRRTDEALVIDLVCDQVPQFIPEKKVLQGIRVDLPEEILVNKLCALLSRAEIRDLVDVRALEGLGYRVEDAIVHAAAKDGGLTPAQLAWVLGNTTFSPESSLPGNVSSEDLKSYQATLITRLTRMAFPKP